MTDINIIIDKITKYFNILEKFLSSFVNSKYHKCITQTPCDILHDIQHVLNKLKNNEAVEQHHFARLVTFLKHAIDYYYIHSHIQIPQCIDTITIIKNYFANLLTTPSIICTCKYYSSCHSCNLCSCFCVCNKNTHNAHHIFSDAVSIATTDISNFVETKITEYKLDYPNNHTKSHTSSVCPTRSCSPRSCSTYTHHHPHPCPRPRPCPQPIIVNCNCTNGCNIDTLTPEEKIIILNINTYENEFNKIFLIINLIKRTLGDTILECSTILNNLESTNCNELSFNTQNTNNYNNLITAINTKFADFLIILLNLNVVKSVGIELTSYTIQLLLSTIVQYLSLRNMTTELTSTDVTITFINYTTIIINLASSGLSVPELIELILDNVPKIKTLFDLMDSVQTSIIGGIKMLNMYKNTICKHQQSCPELTNNECENSNLLSVMPFCC